MQCFYWLHNFNCLHTHLIAEHSKKPSFSFSFFAVCALTSVYLPMAFLPCVYDSDVQRAWSPAVTGNPEKHLARGSLRYHWVKQLLCSHYDSHQEGRTLQGEEFNVEVTHVFMMPSTIIAWFSTVWGISNFLRQFSGPKTSRANKERKKRGRKKDTNLFTLLSPVNLSRSHL